MEIFLKNIEHYHPSSIISNELLRSLSNADPEWVTEKTGIKERRYMDDYEGDFPGLELISRCFLKWKKVHNASLKKISMIISASSHEDIHYPNPGNIIAEQENLDVPVFQLKSACTSVAYAIYVSVSMLEVFLDKDILVLNGEAFTRYVDYGDKKSCILFGDAASIFLISKTKGDFKILDIEIGGKGLKIVDENRTSDTSHLYINEMATADLSPGKPWINRRRKSDKKFQQDGRAVIDFVMKEIPPKVTDMLSKLKINIDEIDHVILHQANLNMMRDVVATLGIPENKHLYNIDKFGNTSSSGWMTVLSENKDKISKKSKILVIVFGAGMTWSNIILEKT